jgi:hypothetical protein
MMMKNKFFICSVLIVVLTACIYITGCTSPQSTQSPAQTSLTAVPTSLQPPNPTVVTTGTSPKSTTAPTVLITTTPTPPTGVSVTINSAAKKTTLGGFNPTNGSVFLVLDVTLQNNDIYNDFAYTPASFQIIADNKGSSWHTPSTAKFSSGLNNQLTSGTIPFKSKISGQIVFGVSDTSNVYKFSVIDSSGTAITKIENIRAS